MKTSFLRKFSQYFLIGLSTMILLGASQQMVSGDVLQRGPNPVLADEDDCATDPNQLGCDNSGGGEGGLVPDEPAPEPAQPAPAPVCTTRSYNECVACNTSRPVVETNCGGNLSWDVGANQTDSACSSWCESAQPPAQGAPQTPSQPSQPSEPATPPATITEPSNLSAYCSGGSGNFSWSAGFKSNLPASNYALRINKEPFAEWIGAGDFAFQVGSQTNYSTGLSDGNYRYSVQAGFPDGSESNQIEGGTFSCQPSVCTPNGSCSAGVPACGTSTQGVDNCGNTCTRQGPACQPPPACVSDGSCSAPTPACGTTTSGADNCGNSCTKQGVVCQPPPGGGPALTCPAGTVGEMRDNVLVCIQTIVINTNTNTNTNTSSSTSSNVNNISFANVGVGAPQPQVAGVSVTQLPKTGLSALAWTALAFIPAGFGMRRFSKVKRELEDHPSYIFDNRKFKAES